MARSSLFLFLTLLSSAVSGCVETTLDASYPTMAEAISAGAVSRGWIPAWLPKHSTNLREVHDLDSNESALVFQFSDRADWPPSNQCHPEEFAGITPPRLERPWWPSVSELETSYVFYSCFADPSPASVFVGVHKSERRAVHWRVNTR